MYYCKYSHGSPTPEHKDACPWCFLKRRRYPVPPWEMDRLPPPTKEQLDRLLHRTSDGLGCHRWVFLLIFVFLLGWLLWAISPVCLDWYDATKGIIPFVDLIDEIAENAGLALSVLQLPLYTFIPLQISGGLDPFNGLQPSQFAINEARGPIEIALAICQELSETEGTADEEIKNMTKSWDDAHLENWLYFVMLPDHAVARGQETKPQEALRLTNTYITLITEGFMTLSDRHPDNFTMAALSEDSLDILDTVIPIRVDQLHEMINNFRHRKHALMEAMSQIIEPLKACQEYFNRINHTKNAFETKEHIFHANHIANLYKLSVSKLELAESAAKTLSSDLKRKYFLRLGGDLSEVAVGLSRVQNKLHRIIRTRDRALKWYRRERKRRNMEPDFPIELEKDEFRYRRHMDDDRRPAWVKWKWWCRRSWARCGVMLVRWTEEKRQHEY